MATELTPIQVINLAKICQVLAVTDRGFQNATKGAFLDQRLPTMLYNERKAVEWVYSRNSADSGLQGIANYLYELCYPYIPRAQQIINNQSSVAPTITGPTNQSVTVGATATFSVSVTGTPPFTYQWFLNGVAIPGATGSSYSKTNSQLSDSGGIYSVQVSNPAAPSGVFSQNATLTVSAALVGYFAYMDVDPSPDLQANIDNFTYQTTFNITHNSPFVITLPAPSTPNKYLIVRVPIGESLKTVWNNTILNNGNIPDSVWQNYLQFNSLTYYYTRVAASLDTSQTLTLS